MGKESELASVESKSVVDSDSSFKFVSELYAKDAPAAWLLAEYPSSNSSATLFRNESDFIIHDPFPPPRPELLKVLGPHHLMFGWGTAMPVTSQAQPDAELFEHWEHVLGEQNRPIWLPFEMEAKREYVTLFPHQALREDQQVVPPKVNYQLHSKSVIGEIRCNQAEIYNEIQYPCVVKLSHGYAGLGNYFLNSREDEEAMRSDLSKHWPKAELVVNSIVEDILGDFGVQFYLRRDGSTVWLGFTQQKFDESKRWCGGEFSAAQQASGLNDFQPFIAATGEHLHREGYFGVVGIDLLKNGAGDHFLVDVNPRLTGITPFLIASRIFAKERQLHEGVYQASCRFKGSQAELIAAAQKIESVTICVLSAFEDSKQGVTICHLSASSNSQNENRAALAQLTG